MRQTQTKGQAVYLMKEVESNRIKIGVSANPRERVSAINLSVDNDVVLIFSVYANNAYKIEKKMHKRYNNSHLFGEWFELDEEEIKNVKARITKLADQMENNSENDGNYMEDKILKTLLLDGALGPTGLSSRIGHRRPSISNKLSELKEKGMVYDKGGGVYCLTKEGITIVRSETGKEGDSENIMNFGN